MERTKIFMSKINTAGMSCDEITDLIYDIRDGRVNPDDVIWHFYKPEETPKQDCSLCKPYGLEKGDTLYQIEYPDTGIDFYAIRNIQYCPLCGKKLREEED